MDPYPIPSTPQDWANIVGQRHATADPYGLDISNIGPNAFGSASKLKYEDWLLLRVLWQPTAGKATHKTIFGDKAGSELKAAADRQLAKEPWMQALKSQSHNPMQWSYMAAWKLNLAEIVKRVKCLRNLEEGKIYDDSDPFRLLVEPSDPRRRPHRNVVPPQYFGRGPGSSDRASSQSSSVSTSSAPYVSPTHTDRLAASSGAAGSLRGRDGASTPESGLSAEGRMINKHRPDEALVNMTLLLLLQGVCMPLLQQPSLQSYSWSIVHKQFSVSHPDPDDRNKRSKIMTARTDGYLQATRANQDLDSSDALAIIEVKPFRRFTVTSNQKAVQIQEGAEMAAWISTESTKGLLPTSPETKTYRRLLISQDYDQVFIIIAEYDDLYIQHIRGDSIKWPRLTPEASPSKKGRPGDDPRGGTSSDEDSRGRSKGATKPGFFSAFRSPSKAPGSSTQPASPPPAQTSTRLPSRSHPLPPVTPSKPGARPGETTPPQAPKQTTSTANVRADGRGFLRMIPFAAFDLNRWEDIEALIPLLYSLTSHLTGSDVSQTLRFQKSVPDRSRGSK
ncbi:hypothetical protein CEP52_005226 [Fusarium oligoseptatum]|uniref:Uncharacterized protein n=1 Tax=Fusarium oligoseptatum TaxID=2604345 RepID=A0A428TZF8_9HYPO|nr:hypothetical protein CEP52_005226 [Fusarium oligoseptatum]